MNNKDTKNLVQNMKFEIDPLDINLVKIQQEFQKKVEITNLDLAPIILSP